MKPYFTCPVCQSVVVDNKFQLHLELHEEYKCPVFRLQTYLEFKYRMSSEKVVSMMSQVVEQYVNDSIPTLVVRHKLPYKVVVRILEVSGITLRKLKAASAMPNSIKAKSLTCVQKYGCLNPSQSSVIKKKKSDTFMKHYGVDNIFKYQEFIDNNTAIILEKYGVKRVTNAQAISQARMAFSVEKKDQIKQKFLETIDNRPIEIKNKISQAASDRRKLWWANLSEITKPYCFKTENMAHLSVLLREEYLQCCLHRM